MLALSLAGFIISVLVIYMFYARLRGIEEEIMKFRIAYEFSHTTETRTKARQESRDGSAWPEPPKPLVPATPSPQEQKYMPKGSSK
jgi:hypothetical protein